MNFSELKDNILNVMRESASKQIQHIEKSGVKKNQDKTKTMNKSLEENRDVIFRHLSSKVDPKMVPTLSFLVTYCWIVISIETRNSLWNYNSMDLSRRSGELWETLLKNCWSYPINKTVTRFEAPSFSDVSRQIQQAFREKLQGLRLPPETIEDIFKDYKIVWSLLGESINLNSDELFETMFDELQEETLEADIKDKKIVVDFKGSYGSNEKGNKERLLTVARIYDLLNAHGLTQKPYECILAVRTVEEGGHNYLRQLEVSGLWTVKRGHEVYDMVKEYTGCDILNFVRKNNMYIVNDLNTETQEYMTLNHTSKQNKSFAEYYLTWW
ncbi:hypothetical protein ACU1JV_20720 [Paenibacillus sp. T2-29]|uniref:hypothetical protein n=1 Tax=Paenibacillus TaxID=44249 RepID=UPI000470A43A|nr:hypothetical protein [Paenibacillus polymyxa]